MFEFSLICKNFSPFGYRRIDNQSTNIEHNQYLLEEAIFAIHQKLAISGYQEESSVNTR